MHSACLDTVLVPTSPPGVMSKRKERPLLERVADEGNCKFARALGSVDYHTREKGLQALALWLSRKHDIGELEMLKLWRGLFYCFWHSDKQPVQAALAERLSDLLLQLPEQVALLYYAASLKTLRREWFGIDHLRLNKFLMLVRKFFNQALRLLQASDWSAEQVQLYTDLWLQEVLLPQDNLAAAGLAYHTCDLLLPELAAVCSSSGSDGASAAPQPTTLRALLEPFCQALARTRDPALVYRLRQGVFDPLVKEVGDVDALWLDPLDAAALAAHLFDLGAQQETRTKNREALYSVSTALEKAGKQRQRHQQQQAGANGVAHAAAKQPQALANGVQQQKAKKKKKKRSAEEAGMVLATPGSAAPASNAERDRAAPAVAAAHEPEPAAVAPATVSKPKKKKAKVVPASAGRDLAQQAAAAAADLNLDGQHVEQEQHAAEEQQQPPISVKKKKKKKTVAAAAAAAGPGGGEGGTPAAAPVRGRDAAASAGPTTTGGKKNVRFSLRKNLVMTIGQPPLPEDVRTPPTSKPKGSALKVTSSLKAAPGSAPGRLSHAVRQRSKLGEQQQGSKSATKAAAGRSGAGQSQGKAGARRALMLLSPQSQPRAKAAEFF